MSLAPLMTSKDLGWCTPIEILKPLRTVGRIALDPCSNEESIVDASRSISLPDDGLAAEWTCEANELIYVNPPYGRQIAPWVARCAHAATYSSVLPNVVALLPARTDTKWWQEHVRSAAVICFWRGRLKFSGHTNSAPFPSALVLWTWREATIAHLFLKVFGQLGHVVRP